MSNDDAPSTRARCGAWPRAVPPLSVLESSITLSDSISDEANASGATPARERSDAPLRTIWPYFEDPRLKRERATGPWVLI